MKLLFVVIAISIMSLSAYSDWIRGGDMPFPIGKIIDFPKDDGKGVWKDELKKKIFRLRPLKGVLPDGTILVQMLGLQKNQSSVLAEGLGEIGADKVLRARLRYLYNQDKVIDVQIAHLCSDATFDNNVDFNEMCKESQMWASVRIFEKNQKYKGAEHFVIKKISTD